jgi:serine kinase of HPr protein (carbohydrate metabolism regulator)
VVYPDAYYESLSVFRKLCNYVLSKKDGIIFHSSAIMVDGKAYLFTAPSGTGKSTHTRLWRELLGDRAVMINDDKPIIRYEDNKFFVYGTPWNGKHSLDTNCRAEIKGICSIYQSKENVIRKADSSEMLPIILNQTLRPASVSDMDRLLGLIDKMLTQVSVYKLGCNISLEAAELSYKTMSGEAQ